MTIQVRRTGPTPNGVTYRDMMASIRCKLEKLEYHLDSEDYGRLKAALDQAEHAGWRSRETKSGIYVKIALPSFRGVLTRLAAHRAETDRTDPPAQSH